MSHRFVYVLVNVRFGAFVPVMRMLMVLVMPMSVAVNQIFVLMLVGMRFCQYQPGGDRH